ncbi:LuxR C-terminal-related transcriptional regulator [Pararhodobacter zhoushanensis]|uniref:Response regulator transcription factor n=1 Tax=Pararhodobacter zhoushanensis TaxID=2479545 RepID=A0ABT3GW34_9RHOB|nr:response regulator transcription factor [Pararhodobacter zhoushanensis]MCW1931741.1 response regulator transcription factor [Pararhodobacter zhoushanensis]
MSDVDCPEKGPDPAHRAVKPTVDVLIVEDRLEIAKRLERAVLGDQGFRICSIAHTRAQGLRDLARHRPRAVLVDLGLPDGSGVDVIRAAEAADWDCDSLVVTVFGDEGRVFEAIRAGAKGYILKNDRLEEISQKLHTVLEGGSPISPQIARFLLKFVPQQNPEAAPDEPAPVISLTTREHDILKLIAMGFKRQEVADKLQITLGTVGSHVNNVYRKLEVSSNTEAVAVANRLGLF